MQKSFSIISLGCPRNLVDSEGIISEYRKKGYVFQEDIAGVDTVIVNTCGFIEDAKKESIDTILQVIDAKKRGQIKKIVIAGCLSERYPKELRKQFKEADEVRGIFGFNGTVRSGLRLTPTHYAYLKISEGCKNRCTYCIIPYIKGPYRSRSMNTILEEADAFIKDGVKEIVLIGQDTSLYGIDLFGKKKLDSLLKQLAGILDKTWIRLLYCHPANLDKDVIKVIRDSKNICRYIDLPIEHISDGILQRMGRRTRKKDITALIEYIRKEIKGVGLRTSFIVGFPGETEKDFQELLRFIKEFRFERMGLFKYSREEGTPAYKYMRQISEKEKEKRFSEAMLLQQSISKGVNESFKGRTMRVLIDGEEDGCYIARSEYDAPEVDGVVYVKGKGLKIGDFYDVRITDTYEYDLVGEIKAHMQSRNLRGT